MLRKHTRFHHSPAKIFWYGPAAAWAIKAPIGYRSIPRDQWDEYVTMLQFACHGSFYKQAKVWIIPDNPEDLEEAKKLVQQLFGRFLFQPRISYRPLGAPSELSHDYLTEFKELVGYGNGHDLTRQEAKKLYRSASMRLHPDIGGDGQKMASLNVAYSKILAELEDQ